VTFTRTAVTGGQEMGYNRTRAATTTNGQRTQLNRRFTPARHFVRWHVRGTVVATRPPTERIVVEGNLVYANDPPVETLVR